MKNLIKVEEVFMFLLSIILFNETDYAWWLFLVLILTPDIGMVGYAFNTRVGAFTYNLFHHKGVAIIILSCGWYFSIPILELAGIILFAHSSLDRMLGYGLKFSDSFKHTHLENL